MNTMRLGIVIVSWNVRELLDQCLNSLLTVINNDTLHNVTPTPDVIVVDNASHDGSANMVRTKHPWVSLSCFSENRGYVEANNTAITHLLSNQSQRPDALWLLNPDTIIHKTTVTELLGFMGTHPRAGLIGPKLLNPDGTLQESAFRFPGLLQPMFDFGMLPQRLYYTVLNGRYSSKLYNSDKPFKVDHPLGAGMMVRTKTIDEVGLLDNDFFMYCEEIDWAWRMKKAGWENWLVPSATITHYAGASTRQAKPATTAYLWESRARLYRKHRNIVIAPLVAHLVRKHFGNRKPETQQWTEAYQRIIQAWQ